ncbi:MAG: aminopeptidase P N-terminal domain-containing protein [Flavobacteriales bacterium]|nr:aminopeptidase P N-terminal domain-containing protein [Flavobacteriales bacterium]
MKYLPIDSNLYVKNRAKLAERMMPNSLALFNSNDILPTNADGEMPFRQNNDLLYLSGVDQEESILLIFPDSPTEKHREILFLKETNEEIAIWEGEKLTKEKAFESSGIKTVYWIQDFNKILKSIIYEADIIYLNDNEHLRANVETETRDDRFTKWIRKEFPLHTYDRIAPITDYLRSIKEPEEIELMQTACNLTEAGVKRILKFIKPGVMEYEIEAELMHEFLRGRSKGFAYSPIVASGCNACVLHYIENNQECKDGDLILMDVGAEYANYASDLTRTIPVNGKFTERQAAIYNSVRTVMKKAENILKPGILLADYHLQVGEFMTEELLKLNLISQQEVDDQNPDWPAYKKYFMHGTSHYIGLDVHDVGSWYKPIEAGMVFTIEPGIYIREESTGIRLENNYLITEDGNKDLMAHIPIELKDIEAAMKH